MLLLLATGYLLPATCYLLLATCYLLTTTLSYLSKVSDRGVDWHGNFPYATLLDASKGGLFGWGGAEKSLPNHMHDLTFWNFNQSDKETQWLNWDW